MIEGISHDITRYYQWCCGKNHQKPAPSEAKALNLAHLGTDNLRATAQELGIDPLDCPGPGPEFGDHHAPLEDWAPGRRLKFWSCWKIFGP